MPILVSVPLCDTLCSLHVMMPFTVSHRTTPNCSPPSKIKSHQVSLTGSHRARQCGGARNDGRVSCQGHLRRQNFLKEHISMSCTLRRAGTRAGAEEVAGKDPEILPAPYENRSAHCHGCAQRATKITAGHPRHIRYTRSTCITGPQKGWMRV